MRQSEWLEWAIELQNKMDKLFWDEKGGAYFSVDGGDETLVLRLKEDYDGAEPSYVCRDNTLFKLFSTLSINNHN